MSLSVRPSNDEHQLNIYALCRTAVKTAGICASIQGKLTQTRRADQAEGVAARSICAYDLDPIKEAICLYATDSLFFSGRDGGK